ncbi:MAG TPA: PorV/PorQ family protein [archaeon]|nr:PorV/PorQ family protein [archaeon]
MLRKTAIKAMSAACLILLFVAPCLYSQGVMRQEYSGLDKYSEQGRPEAKSFVGVRAAEFLTIPVGARGIALGSAYSAICEGVSSIWWNPAGLGFLEDREAMVTVVDYTLDLTYTYGAFAMPVGDGRVSVGAFFGYLDIPDMKITTINSPLGTGRTFNAYDFQMGGSLAYNLSDRFTGGISLKYVHQDVFNNIAGNAFAIDAGGIYHTELMDREIKFAFAIQNLGSNITMRGPNMIIEVPPEGSGGAYSDFSTDPNAMSRRESRDAMYLTHTYRLPTTVKVALSYNLFTNEKVNWLLSGELWRNSNIPISYATGTELSYNFNPVITAALRMGWKIQTDEFTDNTDQYGYEYMGENPTFRGLSFGGGFTRKIGGKSIQFNYAYRNKGQLSSDNFFSFTFGF